MKERPILMTPENAQKCHEGTNTQTRRIIKSQPPEDVGKILVTLDGRIAQRIRRHHAESQIGNAFGRRTHIEKYVIKIIESFLSDHRSGRVHLDPNRYLERNGSDADHAIV